jgi:hypothetical protein
MSTKVEKLFKNIEQRLLAMDGIPSERKEWSEWTRLAAWAKGDLLHEAAKIKGSHWCKSSRSSAAFRSYHLSGHRSNPVPSGFYGTTRPVGTRRHHYCGTARPVGARRHYYCGTTRPVGARRHHYCGTARPVGARRHYYCGTTRPVGARRHYYCGTTRPVGARCHYYCGTTRPVGARSQAREPPH